MKHRNTTKLSLQQQLLNELRASDGWVCGATLDDMASDCGYKAATANRVLRILSSGIAAQIDKKCAGRSKTVFYRAKEPTKTVEYRVEGKSVLTVNQYD